MQLVRCDACGAKAILAASQCPRCTNPFWLRMHNGNIVPLSKCSDCNTWFEKSKGSCKWCVNAPVRQRSLALPVVIVMVVLVAALVAWRTGLLARDSTGPGDATPMAGPPRAAAGDSVPVPPMDTLQIALAVSAPPQLRDSAATAAPVDVAPTAARAPLVAKERAPAVVGPWTRMRAVTWVNVRQTTGGNGDITGVINPDTPVLLGANRGGWRAVRAGALTGWVDGRHFRADTARP
jgi:hypothetical protein